MARNDVILRKLARLEANAKPRLLDLFAGCGGISLGFQAAGFEIRGAVEFDPEAAKSHGLNFHGGAEAHSRPIDITQTNPVDLCTLLDVGSVGEAFDVIVGGPPCQAFARVGRSKLREIEAHPEAFMHDPRAQLYKKYLEYVDAFQPLAVLMENVPDILNHGGHNVAEETCEVLEDKGYVCGYTLLNAAFYGVPQMRERMFLVAYRRELAVDVSFPSPTNWLVLPPGYEGSRSVALKSLRNLFDEAHSYIEPPVASRDLPLAVTAEDALGDLPVINARELLTAGKLVRGARRFDTPVSYGRKKPSAYAELMRNWPGHEAPSEGLKDHVIRYLPRDYELFARMNPGDQYPEAYAHAVEMFRERLAAARARGERIMEGSAKYKELWASIVPPYDATKFPNKWRKMWRDQPARTLMAHLGKDSYSHIHYDSRQARTISVREAARLQSFPDGFRFAGTMNPAFRQIGNAVPPLLAKALAAQMMQTLKESIAKRKMTNEPRRAPAAVS
ncbi:DNA cytosine methyltransferase [Burkholderia pseudomallei]|uniref:DNA cytosine methyltransferase n=2 Tax=Burkholderia pseudomallei TaxID=28450 RepID=UPI00052A3940|nr:DNA cytosine methyltransferase [Burkholderia pseudomallei]AIV50676.1 DNA (cytosine-5-)-methyltransferase family protein [Burkholderia pseudomallei MSHR1153]KGV82854.1 DNA (cytosine-5-)-methyltransferase family protein [Burkholderia pseudomallei MSHR4375]